MRNFRSPELTNIVSPTEATDPCCSASIRVRVRVRVGELDTVWVWVAGRCLGKMYHDNLERGLMIRGRGSKRLGLMQFCEVCKLRLDVRVRVGLG